VLALTKAIRQKESGGDYRAVGDNNTSRGAYQFQEGTWKQYAKEILGDENAEMSEANQNAVAYGKVKQWKDKGLGPAQIAAAWNAGPERAMDGSWTTHKGVTKRGGKELSYDTPAYVKAVVDFYRQQSQGQAPTTPQKTFSGAIKDIQEQAPQRNFFGANKSDSMVGKLLDNSITRGLINIVPGAKTLGESLGTMGGLITTKAKEVAGAVPKGTTAQYDVSAPSPLETAKAGAQTVGTALALTGAGKLAQGGLNMLKPTPAMKNPLVTRTLKQALNPGEKLETMTRKRAIERLSLKLDNLKTSEVGGPLEKALLQALKELQPVAGEVKRGILQRILSGDKVGLLDLYGGYNLARPLLNPVVGAVKEAVTGTGRFKP